MRKQLQVAGTKMSYCFTWKAEEQISAHLTVKASALHQVQCVLTGRQRNGGETPEQVLIFSVLRICHPSTGCMYL